MVVEEFHQWVVAPVEAIILVVVIFGVEQIIASKIVQIIRIDIVRGIHCFCVMVRTGRVSRSSADALDCSGEKFALRHLVLFERLLEADVPGDMEYHDALRLHESWSGEAPTLAEFV